MKKWLFFALLLIGAMACNGAPKLVYNGDTLEWNTDWVKRQCGTLDITENIIEVSGIACSRVTPGYIWMQSDETEKYIIATDEKGAKRACKLKMSKSIGWDWEDMSGGVYEGTNYLFIGSFGDNDEQRKDYRIIWFEEPAIDSVNMPEQTVTPNYIRYKYPDGKSHNNEALMYDNLTSTIYIITKVYYDVCQVFKMPFRLDYNTSDTVTVEYVCDLGVKSDLGSGSKPSRGFHLVTAADISPDGKYILIKNHNNIIASYCWVLYWERQEGESIDDAIKRQPQPIKAYNTYEWQGEAICWLDDNTFYTTSDADDGNPPIFKFTRKQQDIETIQPTVNAKAHLTLINNVMYVSCTDGLYTLDGRKVERAE